MLGFNVIDNTWYNPFGSGINNSGNVWTLIIYKDVLYIGGEFNIIDGTSVNNIAAFDLISETWLLLFGSGLINSLASTVVPSVYAIYAIDNILYIGGNFRIVNGSTFNNHIHGLIAFNLSTNTWFNPFGLGLANTVFDIIYLICRTIAYNNNILYIGGDFFYVNGNNWNYIAAFNITTNVWFNPFGTGADNPIGTLYILNNYLYICGGFTTINGNAWNYIAAFNTLTNTLFNPFGAGSGLNGGVFSISSLSNILYIGGGFTSVNGNSWNYIAALNTSTNVWFNPFGSGTDVAVRTVYVGYNATLYASGFFTLFNNLTVYRLAAVNLESCSITLGYQSGVYNQTNDCISIGDTCGYTGQNFYSMAIGDESGYTNQYNSIAIGYQSGYDTQTSGLAIGYQSGYTSQYENSIAIGVTSGYNNQLDYSVAIGHRSGYDQGDYSISLGNYTELEDYSQSQLSQALSIGFNSGYSFQYNNSIAIGNTSGFSLQSEYNISIGSYSGYNSQISHIGFENPFSSGLDNTCYSIFVSNDILYAGGNFTTVDISSSTSLGIFNITSYTWTAIGNIFNGPIYCSLVIGNVLYIGGSFTTVNGNSINNIVTYDITGGTWINPFGVGLNNTCRTMVNINDILYVGGDFTRVNNILWTRISKFNTTTSTWSNPFGTGLNNTCYTIIAYNNILYVGGLFTTAGSTGCGSIVTFNTNTGLWSNPFGTGLAGGSAVCYCLLAYNNILFIGGNFTSVNGNTSVNSNVVGNLISFNILTSTWVDINRCSSVLYSVTGTCYALTINRDDVIYIGGSFTINANDTSSWNNIIAFNIYQNCMFNPFGFGSGLNGPCYTLFTYDDILYIGGTMYDANGVVCFNIVSYYCLSSNSIAIGKYSGYDTQTNGIAIGYNCGSSNSSGICVGYSTADTNQSKLSIALGNYSGQLNQQENAVAIGVESGNDTQGTGSIAIGYQAGKNFQGTDAISIGNLSGQNYQGNYSTTIGDRSGIYSTGTNIVCIGNNSGASGVFDYSICLGYNSSTGTSLTTNTFATIQGMSTISGGSTLTYNTYTGLIGVSSSSLRYKEDVQTMCNEYSNRILDLEPVLFKFKDNKQESFGLIAEDVYRFVPELAPIDSEQIPFTVNYELLNVLLLNKLKDLEQRADILENKLKDRNNKL